MSSLPKSWRIEKKTGTDKEKSVLLPKSMVGYLPARICSSTKYLPPQKIILIRINQAILDFEIARLYGVETKHVNQAVRNNPEKFPYGYVLELSEQEWQGFYLKPSPKKDCTC